MESGRKPPSELGRKRNGSGEMHQIKNISARKSGDGAAIQRIGEYFTFSETLFRKIFPVMLPMEHKNTYGSLLHF